MGFVSCLEDIEKIAEGASPTPTTMIEINGIPYHSEEARKTRLDSPAKSKRVKKPVGQKKCANSGKKQNRLNVLEAENQILRDKVKKLQSKIEQIQGDILIRFRESISVVTATRRPLLHVHEASKISR